MKHLFTTFLFGAIILGVFPSKIVAQRTENTDGFGINEEVSEDESLVIKSAKGLRAEFEEEVQDPGSKEKTYKMILYSDITSRRVKITWTINGVSKFKDKTQAQRIIDVDKGGIYTLPITIIPTQGGANELLGIAEAVQADSTLITSVRKNFATNANNEVLPLTDEYKSAKTIYTVTFVAIRVALAVFVMIGLFFGFKYFIKWYNRDDIFAYEQAHANLPKL